MTTDQLLHKNYSLNNRNDIKLKIWDLSKGVFAATLLISSESDAGSTIHISGGSFENIKSEAVRILYSRGIEINYHDFIES